MKSDDLASICHDLQNPLSVIGLNARLLKLEQDLRGASAAEQRQLQVIDASRVYLQRVVAELLEASSLEAGQLRLHLGPTALAPLVRSVVDRVVPEADRSRVLLLLDPSEAIVDRLRLERVLANLLINAIEHAPGAPIVLTLRSAGGFAEFDVEDHGPGLTTAEAGEVFEKYRRGTAAADHHGFGLGLHICRTIVEAHGGRITVSATPGDGARFHFTLPLIAAAETERESHEPASAAVAWGTRVLLVDDQLNAVTALADLLSQSGLEVAWATTGAKALEQAAERPPDAVVLDLEMGPIDGLCLLGQLRRRLPGLPAVFVTGYDSLNPRVLAARLATATACIEKPIELDELLQVLGRALGKIPRLPG